jgi:hypothetical protein
MLGLIRLSAGSATDSICQSVDIRAQFCFTPQATVWSYLEHLPVCEEYSTNYPMVLIMEKSVQKLLNKRIFRASAHRLDGRLNRI